MPWRIRGILRKYCGTDYGRPERGRPVSARLDELERLEKASDLDPLRSTHITSPGYTHFANLAEVLTDDGRTVIGRGRCLAMMPRQWADWIAAIDNAAAALLAVARAAEELIRDMDGPEADWSTHAVRVALAALDSTPGGGR
jgi:hypothetical protein